MPALYNRLAVDHADEDVHFHYVSASPWQLYFSLRDFLEDFAGYPPGTYNLKTWRPSLDRNFFALVGNPYKYKMGIIEPLMKTFPNRKFIFLGDSGEKDPEVSLPRDFAGVWRPRCEVP